MITLGGRGGTVTLVEGLKEAIDEDEAVASREAGSVEAGVKAGEEACVEAGVEAGLRRCPTEADDEAEVSREASVSREANISSEAREAGAVKTRGHAEVVEAEPVDEADVSREVSVSRAADIFCEARAAGAVKTSSSNSKSDAAISTPTPDPVDEWIEAARESEAGSSNSDFMSIFLQSGGKSSWQLLSKINILSPPME